MKKSHFIFMVATLILIIIGVTNYQSNDRITDAVGTDVVGNDVVGTDMEEIELEGNEVGSIENIALRKFPYPYKAMLAISTDIDGTSLQEFHDIYKYLRTNEETKMGTGLGLDVADSFWMYVATDKDGYIDHNKTLTWKDQMSYFREDWTKPYLGEEIIKFINVGWIDTIHSFGDFSRENKTSTSFTRQHAIEAINELNKHNINIKVWVNHGNESNIQNFGGHYNFTSYQQGDVPTAGGYHTDLTIPYGIQFLWDSRGDDQIGYDSIIFPINLKDGQKVWGFKRFTHVMKNGAIDWLWGIHRFDEQVSEEILNRIVARQQYIVISQHLGNVFGDGVFPDSTIKGFQRLKEYQDRGDIVVTRTSRLLTYNRNHDYLKFDTIQNKQGIEIHINSIEDPVLGPFVPTIEDLRGITFYINNPEKVTIFINGAQVSQDELQINPSDGITASIGIKWHARDIKNYIQ